MDLLIASTYLLNQINKEEEEEMKKKEENNEDDDDSDKENKDPMAMDRAAISDDNDSDDQEPLTVEAAADAFDHENQMDWIKLVDEDEAARKKMKAEEPVVKQEPKEEQPGSSTATCSCSKRTAIPLLDHLCQHFKCSVKELHVLFQTLEKRREIADHLRTNVQLRTNHLVPFARNFSVRCNDLSNLSAHNALAYRGYLGITVRVHYYVKHGIRLRHPHLPCVVENGGGQHKSFYPLEVLSVIIQN